jgi:site-specific recombinase XerC
VFGDEIGQSISSVKTTWRTACEQAAIVDLHLHDLRPEFACHLLESRAELQDVRDFLGHANITTTSRYLPSTTLRLGRALTLLEQHEHRQAATPGGRSGKKDSRKSSTRVSNGASTHL